MTIHWYMDDERFEPGTVADVGNIRLCIRKTRRQQNNKWRLYVAVRTRKQDGVSEDLKREVCVAQWDGRLTQNEAKDRATRYFCKFILDLAKATMD